MQKFLKKDMADLLKNNLDRNAHGRVPHSFSVSVSFCSLSYLFDNWVFIMQCFQHKGFVYFVVVVFLLRFKCFLVIFLIFVREPMNSSRFMLVPPFTHIILAVYEVECRVICIGNGQTYLLF